MLVMKKTKKTLYQSKQTSNNIQCFLYQMISNQWLLEFSRHDSTLFKKIFTPFKMIFVQILYKGLKKIF